MTNRGLHVYCVIEKPAYLIIAMHWAFLGLAWGICEIMKLGTFKYETFVIDQ